MANGIHRVTVKRGLDPREFGLVAFGGAGPMHAAELALELQLADVIVPPSPGATSALGLLFADARHDFMRSFIVAQDELDCARAERLFAEMEAEAETLLRSEGFEPDRISLERMIDMRYIGQVRALSIPVPSTPFTADVLSEAGAQFHRDYEVEYKYAIRELPIESKSLRVAATGSATKPAFAPEEPTGDADDALVGTFDVYFREAGGMTPTTFYDRERLAAGAAFSGPAVVEQYDATTVVPPDASADVDSLRNLIIRVRP